MKSSVFKLFPVHGHMKTQNADVFKSLRFQERFQKAPSSKCFPSTGKRKAGVFTLIQFIERFLKSLFSWPPIRKNKASSSTVFSGAVWMCLIKELMSPKLSRIHVGLVDCIVLQMPIGRLDVIRRLAPVIKLERYFFTNTVFCHSNFQAIKQKNSLFLVAQY